MSALAPCLLLLLAATVLRACAAEPTAAAATPDPVVAAVDRVARQLRDQTRAPGIAVAVTTAGWSHVACSGVAALATGTPVTPDTLFEIGSISKVFTAMLFCRAESRGQLARTDHPGQYLPELRETALDQATLLHLGTYTAGGLPLQFPASVTDHDTMLAWFRQWRADAPPGTQRLYSNPSIGLLGHITAVAAHADFATLLERDLLPQLGLAHTFVRVPQAELHRYAWGHDPDGRPLRVSPGVLDAEAYGLKTTAGDLLRLVELSLGLDALAAPLRATIAGTQVGYFRAGTMTQGLGWEQYAYPIAPEQLAAATVAATGSASPVTPPQIAGSPTLFTKTGSTNGFGAYVAFVPARGIGVVILANRNIPIPTRIAAACELLGALATRQRGSTTEGDLQRAGERDHALTSPRGIKHTGLDPDPLAGDLGDERDR